MFICQPDSSRIAQRNAPQIADFCFVQRLEKLGSSDVLEEEPILRRDYAPGRRLSLLSMATRLMIASFYEAVGFSLTGSSFEPAGTAYPFS